MTRSLGLEHSSSLFSKTPLHERFPPWGWVRDRMRGFLFNVLSRALHTDDGKRLLADGLRGLLRARPNGLAAAPALPYPDLGQPCREPRPAERDDVVFITARFRSGSTLLWNLFRHVPNCTAYYEPFNERRWFDAARRGSHTDPTHRHAEEYWREYEGLEMLGNYYSEAWIDQHLLMEEDSWNPAMKRYIELLIQQAPGRPVLQFNRIDFRLPWLRRQFPRAQLVHLYRHPRDQWCSTLPDPAAFPKEGGFAEFVSHDHYYLCNWARDLRYHFPFLDQASCSHPYQMFYYLWKLSYLFGRRHAHHSLAFEDLILNPDSCLPDLLHALDLRAYDLEKLKALIARPTLGKWRAYADEAWFLAHESQCETVLADYLGTPLGLSPMAAS